MIDRNDLKRLVGLLGTDMVSENSLEFYHYNSEFHVNPLLSKDFRDKMQKMREENKSFPLIFEDNFGVCYAHFEYEKSAFFLGPMSLVNFPESSLPTYKDYYNLKAQPLPLRTFSLDTILEIVGLLLSLICGESWSHKELLTANPHLLNLDSTELGKWDDYSIRMEEVAEAHHTYQEERQLLEYVRRGAVEETLAFQNVMDKSIGRLSNREITHWRNLAIVAITLSTRAAIDGGLTPALAYKISDTYIQQCDNKQTIAELISIRNRAVGELVENVRQNQKIQTQSSYIKASTTYIDRHYREKIYLEDVADFIGLSPTYFSKLFKKEVGMTFQTYVTQVRLEYAANLLRYSNESISTISEYVNFPSQSYFGRYFKQHYHMTPKEYRDLYHIRD